MPFAKFALLLIVVLANWLPGTPAHAGTEPAGQVIVASGTVKALAPGGEVRALRRRSPFYSGETIRTAAASEVQLRFADGALLSLRADSEFRVDDYRYENGGGAGDRSVSTLIKGGLRTITGVIGKQDPHAYQVKTPVATIGVRGTHYEAVLESPESLVLAAWQGGIRVQNEAGTVDLGAGADYAFGRAEAARPPRGLLVPPPALDIATPVGQAQPEKSTEAATGDDNDGQAPGEAGEASITASGDGTTEASAETSAEQPVTTGDDGADTLTAGGTAADGTSGSLTSTVLTADCATCTPPQQIVVDQPADLPASADLRFTSAEWSALQTTPYLGIGVEAGGDAFLGFDGGRVLNHGTDSPVITDNGYGPHEPEYATAPILDVIRRGNAAVDAFGSHVVDAGHTVYWGTWNGNVEPFEIQTDAGDPLVKELIYAPYHWMTLLPTAPSVLAARTGSVSYNSVVVAHGGGSGGGPLTPSNVFFNADVNFDTGAISNAYMNIYNGSEIWNLNFNGQVRGSVLDIRVDTVSSTVTAAPGPTQAVDGDIGMVFTGSNGQSVGGGYMFQSIADPATHVEGVLLVQ